MVNAGNGKAHYLRQDMVQSDQDQDQVPHCALTEFHGRFIMGISLMTSMFAIHAIIVSA